MPSWILFSATVTVVFLCVAKFQYISAVPVRETELIPSFSSLAWSNDKCYAKTVYSCVPERNILLTIAYKVIYKGMQNPTKNAILIVLVHGIVRQQLQKWNDKIL